MISKISSILILCCFSFLQMQAQDQYVWASQLNLRTVPDGEIIAKIPWGSKVRIVERFTSEGFDTIRVNLKYSYWKNRKDTIINEPYALWGEWVKVEIFEETGYLFDAYLSKVPPPKLDIIPRFELIKKYFEREFGISKDEKIGCKGCDDNYRKLVSQDKSIEFIGGTKGKAGVSQFVFNNLSLKEGRLIGYQLFKRFLGGGCGFSVFEKDKKIIVESYCSC